MSEVEDRDVVIEDVVDELNSRLSLADGHLIEVALLSYDKQASELVLVAHHLAIDAVSWPILMEDLFASYKQLKSHVSPQLPAKTTSFRDWSVALSKYANSASLEQEQEYWQRMLNSAAASIPFDKETEQDNSQEFASDEVSSLDAEPTKLLLESLPTKNRRVHEVLLAAVGQTLTDWVQREVIQIDIESHGRESFAENLDVSRTVGWFTSIYPLTLTLPKAASPRDESEFLSEMLAVVADLSDKQRLLLSRWLLQSTNQDSHHTTSRKRLHAYVALENHLTDIDSVTLQNYLREKLPDFMVPDSVSILDSLPLLPNGKVDVSALPAASKTTDDKADCVVEPRNETERVLANIWSELLNLDVLSVHDNFFEIGGDSIVSIQLISRAREAGLNIDPQHVADHPTIAGLASVATQPITNDRRTTGNAPVTPMQHRFLSQNLKAIQHSNQSQLFELDSLINQTVLREAIRCCVEHHDALRTRFLSKRDQWSQTVSDKETTPLLNTVQLKPHQVDEFELRLVNQQINFDLLVGPLVRFVLFQFGNGIPDRLLITAHRLVFDPSSWAILLEDLENVCRQLLAGEQPALSTKTTSTLEWTHRLAGYAEQDTCLSSLSYWTNSPVAETDGFPVEYPREDVPAEASTRRVTRTLDEPTTQSLLQQANEAYHTESYDLLLTALAQTLSKWTAQKTLGIDLVGRGREATFEHVDLSRTIGCFDCVFPLTLDLTEVNDPTSAIQTVKEQLRRVPQHGLDFGVLSDFSNDAGLVHSLAELPAASVFFHFLGANHERKASSLFRRMELDPDFSSYLPNRQRYFLEINAEVSKQRLAVTWNYDEPFFEKSEIERLTQSFLDSLTSLIEHCTSRESAGFTPSDFPETGFNQEDLDDFLGELE